MYHTNTEIQGCFLVQAWEQTRHIHDFNSSLPAVCKGKSLFLSFLSLLVYQAWSVLWSEKPPAGLLPFCLIFTVEQARGFVLQDQFVWLSVGASVCLFCMDLVVQISSILRIRWGLSWRLGTFWFSLDDYIDVEVKRLLHVAKLWVKSWSAKTFRGWIKQGKASSFRFFFSIQWCRFWS